MSSLEFTKDAGLVFQTISRLSHGQSDCFFVYELVYELVHVRIYHGHRKSATYKVDQRFSVKYFGSDLGASIYRLLRSTPRRRLTTWSSTRPRARAKCMPSSGDACVNRGGSAQFREKRLGICLQPNCLSCLVYMFMAHYRIWKPEKPESHIPGPLQPETKRSNNFPRIGGLTMDERWTDQDFFPLKVPSPRSLVQSSESICRQLSQAKSPEAEVHPDFNPTKDIFVNTRF